MAPAAQGRDLEHTQLSAICSTDLTVVSPDVASECDFGAVLAQISTAAPNR